MVSARYKVSNCCVTSQEGPTRWRYDKNFTLCVESLRMKKGIRNTYERKVKEDVFILGRAPFSLAC